MIEDQRSKVTKQLQDNICLYCAGYLLERKGVGAPEVRFEAEGSGVICVFYAFLSLLFGALVVGSSANRSDLAFLWSKRRALITRPHFVSNPRSLCRPKRLTRSSHSWWLGPLRRLDVGSRTGFLVTISPPRRNAFAASHCSRLLHPPLPFDNCCHIAFENTKSRQYS